MSTTDRRAPARRRSRSSRRDSAPTGAGRLDLRSLYGGGDGDRRPLRRSTVGSVDLWSALKLSFLTGVGLGLAIVAGVTLLWVALSTVGVFDDVNKLVGELVGTEADQGGGSTLTDLLGLGSVLTFTTVFAVINTLVVTLLGSLLALIYNLMSALVGGLRVDLIED
ncbi:DUF3566 domain-containing protein [Kytococcus sedentarius]|uniref:DUF3566 domain-containing protein n=1 Tax=Kytococcus sedentarius TaxID=1276 RepID=UPI0035BC4F09